jgi:hypothetical protein
LHLGELVFAESLLRQTFEQFLPCVRLAPERAQLGLVVEELGQLAIQQLDELLGAHPSRDTIGWQGLSTLSPTPSPPVRKKGLDMGKSANRRNRRNP